MSLQPTPQVWAGSWTLRISSASDVPVPCGPGLLLCQVGLDQSAGPGGSARTVWTLLARVVLCTVTPGVTPPRLTMARLSSGPRGQVKAYLYFYIQFPENMLHSGNRLEVCSLRNPRCPIPGPPRETALQQDPCQQLCASGCSLPASNAAYEGAT